MNIELEDSERQKNGFKSLILIDKINYPSKKSDSKPQE